MPKHPHLLLLPMLSRQKSALKLKCPPLIHVLVYQYRYNLYTWYSLLELIFYLLPCLTTILHHKRCYWFVTRKNRKDISPCLGWIQLKELRHNFSCPLQCLIACFAFKYELSLVTRNYNIFLSPELHDLLQSPIRNFFAQLI